MLDLPRAAFSRLPRASDPLHLPVSKPVGVLARTFQGVTPSFHPSEYQFSGISAVHSLFSYKRVALFPWSIAINIAVYLLYIFYTAAIRIKATKNWAARNFLTAQLSAEKRLHSFLMAADAIYGIAFKCFLNTLVLLPQLYTVPSSAGPQMRGRYGNPCGTRSGAEPRSRAVTARAA